MGNQEHSAWSRTARCGELRLTHVGQQVTLMGWAQRIRDIGSLVFIDLRDREGLAQVVFSAENEELVESAKKVKMESVIAVKGVVEARESGLRNPQLPTGDVEVRAAAIKILSGAKVTPFVIADPPQASEELRLKYRYLDLRRPTLQRNIRLRHSAAQAVRRFLSDEGFFEIETPFLTKSTPEGARDYLVPSRIYNGRFFALPQSPQLFKQILMIAGFDKYFQIVRCFRDEDQRADRQPEFTQVDIEMSFAGRDEIFSVTERLMEAVFRVIGVEVRRPFPRLTYEEAMMKYGTDKPDLRRGMAIQDVTDLGESIDSEIFRKSIEEGGMIAGLVAERAGNLSRSRLDRLNQEARELGGKGVIWIKKDEAFKSSLKLSENDFSRLWQKMDAGDESLILLVADKKDMALKVMGALREKFSAEQEHQPEGYRFTWVTDFPLFEWSEEEDRFVSVHHPFTSPFDEDALYLESDPKRVRAKAYDLVLNGYEIGGGSIRIHDLELQRRIFKALGLSEKDAQDKFGFFLESLEYGAPPHGGIALGFDRIVMLLVGENSIREVIPFPKTTSSLCMMTGSPSPVGNRQLKELGISLIKPKECSREKD